MSFWECMVILLVALIVIKPERLPEIAYLLGQWIAKVRFWYAHFFQKCKNHLMNP